MINIIPLLRPILPDINDYVLQLREVWKCKMLSNFGQKSVQMEKIIREYLGCKYVRVVSSCDVGLMLALKALDIPKGNIIVSPFTFNSTANAVIWNNHTIQFADIDQATLNIDPVSVEEKINKDTVAILATNVFGNPCASDKLKRLASMYELKLIFDSAHCYGSEFNGTKLGIFGDVEVFSFQGTKIVTSAEGGAITTWDKEIYDKITLMRNYGIDTNYYSRYIGVNAKMSELNAALGCLTLPKIDENIEERYSIAKLYRKLLKDLPLRFQKITGKTTYTYFSIIFEDPVMMQQVVDRLNHKKVETKRYFRALNHMRCYGIDRSLPNAKYISDRVLCLPMYNGLNSAAIEFICRTIRNVLVGA